MSEFDNSILKRNVRTLIKNNGITQGQLGEILGMSQPNICKALSDNDKKCFTVSQIYDIAEYFQISIDWLLGHTQEQVIISQRSVAELIAKLLKMHIAKCCDVSIQEHIYTPGWKNNPPSEYDGTPNYKAIYFPYHWQPNELAKSFEDSFELESEAEQNGNETSNRPLNGFLQNHQQILDMYFRNQIQDEHYQIILKDYLEKLSSDSIQL